jgi:hypothetical protein
MRVLRVIPQNEGAELTAEQECVFKQHAMVYHMTSTKRLMTEGEVLQDLQSYNKDWPEDTEDVPSCQELVANALCELARVGLVRILSE